jgi:radical SAM protein with 4Fe4S-binding SPASM domain
MAKISTPRSRAFRSPPAATNKLSANAALYSSRQTGARDFPLRPLQVTWEVTQPCTWKGVSGRAAVRARKRQELSTVEAFNLVDEVAAMHVPLLALTGGDPLGRGDLLPILQYASQHAVRTSLTLLPTALLTRDAICDLKTCGLMRAAFWLQGSTAALHDTSAHPGAYRHTLEAIGWCHEVGLPVQVNTTLMRGNLNDLNSTVELLSRLDVALWNVFFFVPPSREQAGELLSAEAHEEAFAGLYAATGRVRFQIKTSEGQHYQRFLLQKRARESRGRMSEEEPTSSSPGGLNESGTLIFVNYAGEVYPSRFLPLSCGNIKTEPLSRVFCDSSLFISLRDISRLKGKCGRCPFATICGGSRARAYALTGDVFAQEPGCAYQPEISPS